MQRKMYDWLFIASAVILVALVLSVNCLQGTPFIGATACGYQLTSSSLIVKVGAAAIFVLFLALLFGPIVAAILHPKRIEKSKTSM